MWTFQGKPFDEVPEGAFGFVYKISHTETGKAYIGKKQFYSHTTKLVKGRKNRKHVHKPSDWKMYQSSCTELKKAIAANPDDFVYEVIAIYDTKSAISYGEVEQQVKRDVLTAKLPDGTPAYWNRNILNRFFAKITSE